MRKLPIFFIYTITNQSLTPHGRLICWFQNLFEQIALRDKNKLPSVLGYFEHMKDVVTMKNYLLMGNLEQAFIEKRLSNYLLKSF